MRPFALLLALPFAAHAAEVEAGFDTMAITQGSDVVAIQYDVADITWKKVTERNAQLQLRITGTGTAGNVETQTTWTATLDTEQGTVALPAPPGITYKRLVVAAQGGDSVAHISSLRVASFSGATLELSVTPSADLTFATAGSGAIASTTAPGTCPRIDMAAVTRTCSDEVSGSSNVSLCMSAIGGACFDPVPLISACGDAISSSSTTIACIEAGAKAPASPAGLVKACADQTSGDTSATQCLTAAMPLAPYGAGPINACGDIMSGTTATMQCIEGVAGATQDPTSAIKACGEATSGTSSALECIGVAITHM